MPRPLEKNSRFGSCPLCDRIPSKKQASVASSIPVGSLLEEDEPRSPAGRVERGVPRLITTRRQNSNSLRR